MVAKLKKDRLNLTLMTFNCERCQLASNMVNDSSFVALLHWRHVFGSQIKKKDRLNLTLMTFSCERCQLASNMVNDSSFVALLHWRRDYGNQIKKRQAKPDQISLFYFQKPNFAFITFFIIIGTKY